MLGPDNDNTLPSNDKAFEKYFCDSDLFKLFEFNDDDDNCSTMNMILK